VADATTFARRHQHPREGLKLPVRAAVNGKNKLGIPKYFRKIRRMGFKIVNGKKHYFVLDPVTCERLAAVLPC
jgi:hypothetical protein